MAIHEPFFHIPPNNSCIFSATKGGLVFITKMWWKVASEPFYVAIITPVIHYCMGGLECTVDAECVDKSGKVIPGLYVAGEAAGGIHGNNRF